MGMDAHLTAIGKFSKSLIPYLEYPEEYYQDVRKNTIIAADFFFMSTDDSSRQLAELLGAKSWDFNTHLIVKKKINWDELERFCQDNADPEAFDKLKVFFEHEFQIFFRPNG